MFKSFLYWLDKPARDSLLERIEKESITSKYYQAFGGTIMACVAVVCLGLIAMFVHSQQSSIPPDTFSVRNYKPEAVYSDLGEKVQPPVQQEVKQVVSLSGPIQQLKNVNKWLKEALMVTYSFGFLNYDKVVDEAYYYFTVDGYQMYLNALNNSELKKALQDDLMNITLVPISEPIVIKGTQFEDGTKTWLLRTDVIINYRSGGESLNDKYQIDTLVVQVPPHKSVKGLGIAQYSLTKK